MTLLFGNKTQLRFMLESFFHTIHREISRLTSHSPLMHTQKLPPENKNSHFSYVLHHQGTYPLGVYRLPVGLLAISQRNNAGC